MNDGDIQAITLFFFFALLDEQRAIEATSDAIRNFKEQISKNPQHNHEVALVSATYSVWKKMAGRMSRGRHNYSPETGWMLPEGVDMGPWKEFQKTAQEDEFLAIIWSQLLKISDKSISQGLGISVGTLRYRTGRALRKLGTLTNPVFVKGATTSLGIVRE